MTLVEYVAQIDISCVDDFVGGLLTASVSGMQSDSQTLICQFNANGIVHEEHSNNHFLQNVAF